MSQFLRAAVPLVILVTSVLAPRAAWAESSGAVSPATVQHVVVREVGEMVEVEIQTSAPLVPNTQVITGPDRIVVDFPGATPSDQLRALKVNRGTLRGVRSGLFFNDPPITRVVLDLTGPQAYHISNTGNVTVVKFARGAAEEFADEQPKPRLQEAALDSHRAHLSTASVAVSVPAHVAGARVSSATLETGDAASSQPALTPAPQEPIAPPQPAEPPVKVSYENGLLSIHADKATLSQVLYEVHLRTQADIAIPAGAEQEKVIADLGPAPARDVLSELLNGSAYNFIFVGDELSLQRVILTRREGSY